MEISLKSTPEVVEFCGAPCRAWVGMTAKGTRVVAFVAAIAVPDGDPAELAEFETDLISLVASEDLAPEAASRSGGG